MSDRYTQRYLFRHSQNYLQQQQYNQLAQENLRLRERLIKYEQINDYIEVLISKNVELQDTLKRERANVEDQMVRIEMRVREEEKSEAQKVEQILKDKVFHTQKKIKQVIQEYQSIVYDQIQLIKAKESHIMKIEEENFQYNKQLQLKNKEFQQINDQAYLLRSEVSNFQSQNLKLKEEKKLIQRALEAAENEAYKLRQYNKEIVNTFAKKQEQFIKKEEELFCQLQEQQTIIKRAQNLITNLKGENIQMKEEGKNLVAKINVQEKQINQLDNSCEKLTINHQQLLQEYRKVCMTKVQLENMYDELQNALERRQQQMADLQLSKEEQGNRARTVIKELEVQILKLDGLLKAKIKDYEMADQKSKTLETDDEFLRREKRQVEEDNARLKEKNKILENDNFELVIKIKKIQEQLARQQTKAIQNEVDLQRYRKQNQELEIKLQHCQKVYLEKQKELFAENQAKVQRLTRQFMEEREAMTHSFEVDKDKIKSTFEFALKQHEALSQKKLDILERDIDEYRKSLETSQRIGKSLPKTARLS